MATEAEAGLNIGWPVEGQGERLEYYAEINDQLFGTNTTLRAQHQTRFGESDQNLTLSGGRALSQRWAVGGDVSVGFQQALYPTWSAGVYPTFAPGRGWVLGLGYRHSEFTEVSSDTLLPGVEYYFGNYRAAYTLFATRLSTGSDIGLSHAVKLDRYYGTANRIGIGASYGEEREKDGDKTLEFETLGASVDGRHWWREDWGVTWLTGVQRHSSSGLIINAQLGLRHRF